MNSKLTSYSMLLAVMSLFILIIASASASAGELKLPDTPVPSVRQNIKNLPRPLPPLPGTDKKQQSQRRDNLQDIPVPLVRQNLKDIPSLSPVTDKKESRTSSYELVFVDNTEADPNPVQQDQPLDVFVRFANTGTTAFNGKYCAAYFNSDGEFVDYIEIKENMSLPSGYGYYTNPLKFHTNSVTARPGTYYIYVYYRPPESADWILIPAGNYSKYVSLTVEGLSYDLVHVGNTEVTPNPVRQEQTFDVLVKFANIGNAPFNGKYCAAYFNSDNEFIDYVEIKENMSLPGESGYYTAPLTFHSAPVTAEPGTYSVYVYYKPAGSSEWISVPAGDYSGSVSLEIISSYDLVLADNIVVNPNPVQQDQEFDVLVRFANIGTGTFSGSYCAAYFNSDNEFADYAEIKENMSLAGEHGYYTNPLVFHSDRVTAEPGTYAIYVYYKPAGSAEWIPIPGGNYSNHASLKIETSSLYDLSLHSNITVNPNPAKQNQATDVTADIINNSPDAFNGTYCAALFDLSREFVDYIEIKNNMSLPAGYHYTHGLSFHSDAVTAGPGDYYIYIFHKPDGGTWIKTAPETFANPVSIKIESQSRTYSVSGYVRDPGNNGINGATVSFSNGAGSAVTDSSGYYSKTVSQGWNGTVSPVMSGYLFYPPNRSYSDVNSDQSDQNYTGTIGSYIISGYVRDSDDKGISGVTLNFSSQGGSATTESDGYYSKSVDHNWTGTVTPGKNDYTFTPSERTYTNVTSDQSLQDYTGKPYALPDINLAPGSLCFTKPWYERSTTQVFAKPESSDKLRGKVRAEKLFEQVSETDLQLSARQNDLLDNFRDQDNTTELRIVKVNTDLLKTVEMVSLNLSEHENHPAFRTRIVRRGEDDFSWHGDIGNGEHGNAIFVVRNDNIAGTIYAGNHLYAVRSLGQDMHVLIHQDPSKFPPDYHPGKKIAPRAYKRKETRSSGTGESVQNVLVAYTEDAAWGTSDISSLIQLAVDETNQSYRNSDISLRLELSHIYQTDYSETGTTADLDRFTFSDDGYMDEVHDLRDSYHADIAILFVSRGSGYAGVAWLNHSLNPEYAFGVVLQQYATGSHTFAHEVGHIQGARHNPENDPETYPFPYGHGYLNIQHDWRTVMSYNSPECPGNYCPRIPYWSNPDVTYQGVAAGTASTHNNARVLNETANAVANFRISDSGETFAIQNIGGSPLRITSVTANQDWLSVSGCPALPFEIPEGESQRVRVAVNWERAGISDQGVIRVNSDDPDEPSVAVQVTLIRTSADVLPQLSVLPDIQDVGAFGGVTSLIVDNTGSGTMYWRAKTNDSWLSVIDGKSGTNHKLITVSCDANTGDERTGTITISAPGAIIDSQTVRIRQAAYDQGNIEIYGTVLSGKDPLCAMVLANGEYTFSCTGTGEYELRNVPPDKNGEIILFCFCDGFAPFRQVLNPYEVSDGFDIIMLPAPLESPEMKVKYQFDPVAGSEWVRISGEVLAEDGRPLCTMVLANGQHVFSCGGDGKYEMDVPLNDKGEITLFVFCDGYQPFRETLIPGLEVKKRDDADMHFWNLCSVNLK